MPALTQSSEQGTQSRPQRRVALVVEDDRSVGDLLGEMLKELGYDDVWQARTENDALVILHNQTPDVVLLDTNLMGIPAHRVANRLRAGGVPFVVVTGYNPAKLPTAFTSNQILRKPIALADLAAALKQATE